jgi:hypothetical protein
MGVALGPMPAELRDRIRAWVTADRWAQQGIGPDAVAISGGPAWCTLLDADGEVYRWFPWDDSIARIEDGLDKVLEVVNGAKYRPELRSWLPPRPGSVANCLACGGAGWLPEARGGFVCSDCSGLGWTPSAPDAEPHAAADRRGVSGS